MKVKSEIAQLLSRVRLLATSWTAAHQAPLSMGFSGQEYWSGLPLLSPKNLGCIAQMRQGGNSHRQLMDSSGMMKSDNPPAARPTGWGQLAKRQGS